MKVNVNYNLFISFKEIKYLQRRYSKYTCTISNHLFG